MSITWFSFVGTLYLTVGEYDYQFNFSLPYQLSLTFTSKIGNIRYEAEVRNDIPWGRDKKMKRSFEVVTSINLNNEPFLAVSKYNENGIPFFSYYDSPENIYKNHITFLTDIIFLNNINTRVRI